MIELSLFRARSFAVANAGMFAFSTAFYALLLCNVLFLTQVWDYSILTAGFAVTPGALMAALTAPLAGRLSDRFGQQVVALPGALLFAAGCALFASGMGATASYASEYLIPTMLTGAGVGFSFASWGSAAARRSDRVGPVPLPRWPPPPSRSPRFAPARAVLRVRWPNSTRPPRTPR